jgi:pterin-4a-carbinolamine dehydratase
MMMLQSIMKNYLNERKASNSNSDVFGLIRESAPQVPITVEESTWGMLQQPERLIKKFPFDDITSRNWFIKELIEDETQSGHHGNILISGLEITVEVWTHDIDAVTELDLEYASRCDDIFNDVELLGVEEHGFR